MQLVKNFNSTGVAPNGRLFATDLNDIQTAAAALADLAQNLKVASVAVGEDGLLLQRHGSGDARLTGMLRVDHVIRALGGIMPANLTSTQRDALAAGKRPTGTVIYNTTTTRMEYNAGSDGTPNWLPVASSGGDVPLGSVIDWPWLHSSIPSNYLLPYGQAVSRTTYAALHALASAAGYPHGSGDGSTTFNLPDYRGRGGIGKDDMGGSAANRVTSGGSGIDGTTLGATGGAQAVTLTTGQLPSHGHSLSGSIGNGTLAAGVGTLALPNHVHSVSDPGHAHWESTESLSASQGDDETGRGNSGHVATHGVWHGTESAATGISVGNPTTNPAISGSPALSGSVANGTLAVAATGSGEAHSNMSPTLIVNKMIRVL